MKNIVITGATSGIGLETARLLVKDGHRLLLIGRRSDRLEKIKAELGENIEIKTLDVRDRQAVQDLFENLPSKFQPLDVVVNNAGLSRNATPTPELDIDDWDEMVDTNIKGFMYVAYYAIKTLKPNKKGQLVNLGSVAGKNPYRGGNVYGATKAFVQMFSKNLRTDLFDSNIRINTINPGAVETEFSVVRFHGDKEKADKVYAGYRRLLPEDIATCIKFAIDAPEHVNIDDITVMPTDQTNAGLMTTASFKG